LILDNVWRLPYSPCATVMVLKFPNRTSALIISQAINQDIGASNFLFSRGLNVNHGALNDSLEGGRRPRVLPVGHDEAVELFIDEVLEIALQGLNVDIAAGEHRDGVTVFGQGEKQVLERGKLMRPLAGEVHRLVQGLFQSAGERRHMMFLLLFHHALQRMLVLACRVHDAGDLGLGHLVWIDAALPDALVVDVQHDAHGVFA